MANQPTESPKAIAERLTCRMRPTKSHLNADQCEIHNRSVWQCLKEYNETISAALQVERARALEEAANHLHDISERPEDRKLDGRWADAMKYAALEVRALAQKGGGK